MSISSARTNRPVQLIRSIRWFQTCSLGATAVELALVGPVFLWLVFGMIETGWLFAKLSLIDRAVANASRFVYTGAQLNNAAVTRESIEQFICDEAVIIADCTENVALELTVISNFSTPPTSAAPCREKDVDIAPTTTFNPGARQDIMFMRVCVTTDLFMPFLGFGLALDKTESGNFQFTSSTTFSNEP